MSTLPFDPKNAVTFDLAHGLVHLDGAPKRVLVPAEALAALATAAGEGAAKAFAEALGKPLGARAAKRLGGEGETRGATVDTVVEHLGGELAIAGLGSLSAERWGKALVLVVDQSPLSGNAGSVLAGVLEAALEGATGRSVRCVRVMADETRQRFLVGNEGAIQKVRGWLGEGVGWGDVLVRLHGSTTDRGEA